MDSKERYGRFVLHSEDARTSAGSFFRAVQLGASGYERHVDLFQSEMLAPSVAQAVADGLKNGLQIQHAQVVRGFEAGRLDKTAFAAYEMIEGRSVGALMERSQNEGHPFAADHALLIVSKAAAALEAAQAKKQIHGFLIPEFIQVTHDGEVSVRAFGLPPRTLRDSNCVGVREARFLAPEVEGTAPLDIRADIFSLGAQLFEMLTGSPLPRNAPTQTSVETARTHAPGTDGMPIPKLLVTLLVQALAEDPGKRFKDAATFKKAVDTLLFSGDYSPTTFNLAFFMHTLFRDEGDGDSARIKAEKTADYRSHVAAIAAGPASDPRPVAAAAATVILPSTPVAQTPPARQAEVHRTEPAKTDSGRSGRVPTPAHPPSTPSHGPSSSPATPAVGGEEIFQTVLSEKKSFPIVPVLLALLVIGGGAGYYFTMGPGAAPAPTPVPQPTLNPAEAAALARVKELEQQLASLEAEKAAAAQKAADEAAQKLEAQAKARGRAVDPAELARAQEEARKKAQAEQETKLASERQKIEDERKKAEDLRAAEAARSAAQAAAAAAAQAAAAETPAPPVATPAPSVAAPAPTPAIAASTPAPLAAAPQATAAPASTGPALLDVSDPGVTPPQLVSQPRVEYPAIARAQRITGTVIVQALIDEQGNVAEARVLRGVSSNSGLNQAALDSVKKRKYKPATANGKPGRAWVAIQIDFKI